MTNSSKNKGDIKEREAVQLLIDRWPDLLLPNPMRQLGAGRKDDVGDLRVIHDVSMQVKYRSTALTSAVLEAARGSQQQAVNACVPYGVGMSPVKNARQVSVRWIMSTYDWPVPIEPDVLAMMIRSGLTTRLVTWLRDEKKNLVPRVERIVLLDRSDVGQIFLSTPEAWFAAYRQTRTIETRAA